jgi:hypothetical protein
MRPPIDRFVLAAKAGADLEVVDPIPVAIPGHVNRNGILLPGRRSVFPRRRGSKSPGVDPCVLAGGLVWCLFISAQPIRGLRELTRAWVSLIGDRARGVNRRPGSTCMNDSRAAPQAVVADR